MLDTLWQDARYGARLLRRSPVFTATAVLSLAIGIGANTAIFTIANALLFGTPTGVTEPDRLVDIGRTDEGRGGFNTVSYPNYLDIRQRASTLEGVYAYQPVAQPMSLAAAGGAESVLGNIATLNYFAVLGARPAAGRLFATGDDDRPGASPIVVLSHSFWVRRFNKDPSVVGGTLRLNGRPFTVIGVASEGFRGTNVLIADVWVPMGMAASMLPAEPGTSPLSSRDGGWLVLGGRLKTGVSVPQAAAELDAIGRALEREYPNHNRGRGLRLLASSPIPGNILAVGGFLALLMGMVSLVLATACANLAGILLARATVRRREMAVRMAIGAGRASLVRQFLTETAMLFALGGAAGLLVARLMTSLLVSLLPTLPLPVDVSLPLDGRVIMFTTGLSLMAALLCGLVPAFQASKTDVSSALKDGSQDPHPRVPLRNAFVVGQVALSIVLIVAAGLLMRALQKAGSVDLGFDPSGVELASLDLSLAGYDETTGPRFARELLESVRALPGVREATLATTLPRGSEIMRLGGRSGGLTVPGIAPPNGRRFFEGIGNNVEPGYFATMRIPLVAGRDFGTADAAGAQPVAIIDEATARQFWPRQDAVGKSVVLEESRAPGTPNVVRGLLVVGVARDLKLGDLGDTARVTVYMPLQQRYGPRMQIVARTTHGQRLADEIRTLIASMNPNLPIVAAQTLEDVTAVGLVPQRVAASVSGSLGLVGALLAAIGIYGMAAYAVSRRTREIGIRTALGAERADIVRMVVWQGMSPTVLGSAIGLILAASASQLLTRLLLGVPPLDPLSFGGAAALFAAIGLGACAVPARRAARLNPIDALRAE